MITDYKDDNDDDAWLESDETKEWAMRHCYNLPPFAFHSVERMALKEVNRQERERLASSERLAMSDEQHARLLMSYRQHNLTLAPIRLLPPEILASIFTHLASNDGDTFPSLSLHHLSLVCRNWRQIALNIPALWTTFHITPESVELQRLLALSDGQERLLKLLEDCLTRSRNLPCSLLLCGHGAFNPQALPAPIFKQAFLSLPRLHRLSLLLMPRTHLRSFFETGSAGSNLRELTLGVIGCPDGIPDLQTFGTVDLPLLHTVFLTLLPLDILFHIRAPLLKTLSLVSCWTCPYGLTKLAQLFPLLERLKLMSFRILEHDTHVLRDAEMRFRFLSAVQWYDLRPPGHPLITPSSPENINLALFSSARTPALVSAYLQVRSPLHIQLGGASWDRMVDLTLHVEGDIPLEKSRAMLGGMCGLRYLGLGKAKYANQPAKVTNLVCVLSVRGGRVGGSGPYGVAKDDESTAREREEEEGLREEGWLCPKLDRLSLRDCDVDPEMILQFARARYTPYPAISSSPSFQHSRSSSSASIPCLPSNAEPPTTCLVSLRGCPGLPEVYRYTFMKLEGMSAFRLEAAEGIVSPQ